MTPRRGNNRGAVRTWSPLCNRFFASKAEAARMEELWVQAKAGAIRYLEFQPVYVICAKPRITYRPDARYVRDGNLVVEDVKGKLERETRIKLAWLASADGINVTLLRATYKNRTITGFEEIPWRL